MHPAGGPGDRPPGRERRRRRHRWVFPAEHYDDAGGSGPRWEQEQRLAANYRLRTPHLHTTSQETCTHSFRHGRVSNRLNLFVDHVDQSLITQKHEHTRVLVNLVFAIIDDINVPMLIMDPCCKSQLDILPLSTELYDLTPSYLVKLALICGNKSEPPEPVHGLTTSAPISTLF